MSLESWVLLNKYKELASDEQIPYESGHDTMHSIFNGQPLVGARDEQSLIIGLLQIFRGV